MKGFIGIAVLALLLTACVNESDYHSGREVHEAQSASTEVTLGERVVISEEEARENLLEMGLDEWVNIVSEDFSLVNMYNQFRFGEYAQLIHDGSPIGESGDVISPEFFGGLKFDDMGFLVVSVLSEGLDHTQTANAVQEMVEMGIIIRLVEFTFRDLDRAIDRLNLMYARAISAGATSWGLGAENAVSVWLDPYTDEQKAIFNDFLLANAFDPALFLILQAVTPEMLEHRFDYIQEAVESFESGTPIAHVGEVEVSQTEIAFSFENTADLGFNYGAPWDLAFYENGNWLPMQHLPGRGSGFWTLQGYYLQSGGIQHYRQGFEWHFGVLPPGRYMFIRDGWLGEWSPNHDRVFAVAEFEITATTPERLPPPPELEYLTFVEVVEVSNITSTGMRIVVENSSPYDIDHRAQIIFVVPAEYTTVGEWWAWQEHHVPFISFDDTIQGLGFIPAGEQMEFDIYLASLFGELPPGDYMLELSIGGRAAPPHPHGWAFNRALIPFTVA